MTKSIVPPMSLFSGLSRESFKTVALTKGQHLFWQDGKVSALYQVGAGKLSLRRLTQAGHMVVLYRAHKGDLVAEASLFSSSFHCDCVANEATSVTAIDKQAALQMLRKDPDFALALMERFALQVQQYRRQLELRALRPAHARVLAGLSDGWLKSTVMQFADDLGLTHEATYRALADLVREGRIEKTGRGRYCALAPLDT